MRPSILILENDSIVAQQALSAITKNIIKHRANVTIFELDTGFAMIVQVGKSVILKDVPESWIAPIYHQDRVEEIPVGFRLLATSDYCKIQALEHTRLPIWSVQFHPEISYGANGYFADPVAEWNNPELFETEANVRIIDNFVDMCA